MLLVIPHAQVAAVGTVQETSLLYLGGHPLHMFGIHRIVLGADRQRGDIDGS